MLTCNGTVCAQAFEQIQSVVHMCGRSSILEHTTTTPCLWSIYTNTYYWRCVCVRLVFQKLSCDCWIVCFQLGFWIFIMTVHRKHHLSVLWLGHWKVSSFTPLLLLSSRNLCNELQVLLTFMYTLVYIACIQTWSWDSCTGLQHGKATCNVFLKSDCTGALLHAHGHCSH